MVKKTVEMPNAIAKPFTELLTKIGSARYKEGISLCSWGVDDNGVEWCSFPDAQINVNSKVVVQCLNEIEQLLNLSKQQINALKSKVNAGTFNLHEVVPTIFNVYTPIHLPKL